MKLLEIKKMEDCFDGSLVYCYEFSKVVTELLMRAMVNNGKLDYFPEFAKPFFKIFTSEGLQIKGILGENNIEVTYPQTGHLEKKTIFEENLRLLLHKF